MFGAIRCHLHGFDTVRELGKKGRLATFHRECKQHQWQRFRSDMTQTASIVNRIESTHRGSDNQPRRSVFHQYSAEVHQRREAHLLVELDLRTAKTFSASLAGTRGYSARSLVVQTGRICHYSSTCHSSPWLVPVLGVVANRRSESPNISKRLDSLRPRSETGFYFRQEK